MGKGQGARGKGQGAKDKEQGAKEQNEQNEQNEQKAMGNGAKGKIASGTMGKMVRGR